LAKWGKIKELDCSYKPQDAVLIFDPEVIFKSYLKAVACQLWL